MDELVEIVDQNPYCRSINFAKFRNIYLRRLAKHELSGNHEPKTLSLSFAPPFTLRSNYNWQLNEETTENVGSFEAQFEQVGRSVLYFFSVLIDD